MPTTTAYRVYRRQLPGQAYPGAPDSWDFFDKERAVEYAKKLAKQGYMGDVIEEVITTNRVIRYEPGEPQEVK